MGFKESANLVSKYLTNRAFDDFVSGFVARNGIATLVGSESTQGENDLKVYQFQEKLFNKRNRIMHWGDMDFEKDDALVAFNAACDAIAILKAIDRERCEAMERSFRI